MGIRVQCVAGNGMSHSNRYDRPAKGVDTTILCGDGEGDGVRSEGDGVRSEGDGEGDDVRSEGDDVRSEGDDVRSRVMV